MAQNIELLGAQYSDVPSVLLPKVGGGTAQFDDTTIASNAASASDITSGKLAFVNGLLITGTASGGGGGLVYETGTWTPTVDTSSYTIAFSNTHATAPCMYTVSDATEAYTNATSSNYLLIYVNFHQLFGCAYNTNNSGTFNYGFVFYRYRSSATALTGSTVTVTHPYTDSGDSSNSYSRYWATETGIKATTTSSSRYWRSGRTYKWIAVWKPTS